MGVKKYSLGVALTLCCAAVSGVAAPALPPPSPAPPEFVDRPYGPRPAPTPPRPSVVSNEEPTPLPRKWIVGGLAVAAVVGGALLFFGARAWRMSRLFGRQYLFPVRNEVAPRLGGERSGGLMAAASFGDSITPSPEPASKAKDT